MRDAGLGRIGARRNASEEGCRVSISNARRRAKIVIALGRGKKLHDKSESERATGTATSRG